MKAQTSPVRLIVGLGNPGPDYASTRHNAGQVFVEEIARQTGTSLTPESKFFGLCAKTVIAGKEVRLLVPTTFMNRSGQSVAALCNFFKIEVDEMLIAHDELDIEPGIAKLKFGGGHGGHNGLRDIISARGNDNNFGRLRIGIGHPGNAKQVSGYVLKRAPASEYESTEAAIDRSIAVLPDLVKGDWEKAMRELHTQA